MFFVQFTCLCTVTSILVKKILMKRFSLEREIQNGLTAFGEPMKKQMMFKESITKEELTDLPLRWFDGEIVVVDNKEEGEKDKGTEVNDK